MLSVWIHSIMSKHFQELRLWWSVVVVVGGQRGETNVSLAGDRKNIEHYMMVSVTFEKTGVHFS